MHGLITIIVYVMCGTQIIETTQHFFLHYIALQHNKNGTRSRPIIRLHHTGSQSTTRRLGEQAYRKLHYQRGTKPALQFSETFERRGIEGAH
jgi:hypothetical protein